MTAQLTDHHGAIDPREFDADHPDRRPAMDRTEASDRAQVRLWGSSTRVPGHPRRIFALGFTLGPIGRSGRIIGDGGLTVPRMFR